MLGLKLNHVSKWGPWDAIDCAIWPFWDQYRNWFLGWIDQCHIATDALWHSLPQVISSHNINYRVWKDPCLPRLRILMTCAISILSNGIENVIYISMSPKINSAQQGLNMFLCFLKVNVNNRRSFDVGKWYRLQIFTPWLDVLASDATCNLALPAPLFTKRLLHFQHCRKSHLLMYGCDILCGISHPYIEKCVVY